MFTMRFAALALTLALATSLVLTAVAAPGEPLRHDRLVLLLESAQTI